MQARKQGRLLGLRSRTFRRLQTIPLINLAIDITLGLDADFD